MSTQSSAPAPLISLTCQPNSHPFDERQIAITAEPLKIGRSVARARPAPNNTIFDCKVLSRNHAVIWYEEDKFWIKDTKSSNGTFVNSHRLSKGAEESAPRQLFSGDIIQFGVDVIENQTTHGCIITQLSLYHPDGTEARRKEEDLKVSNGGPSYANLSQEQVYQLAQYLQEALYREQTLQQKLDTLQKVMEASEEASITGWQVLLNEEHLLAKLELLENQLQLYSKNVPDDVLRAEASRVLHERYEVERKCQTAIEKLLEEKAQAQRREALLQSRLSSAESESEHLRQRCQDSRDQIDEISRNNETDKSDELKKIEDKLKDAEMRLQEMSQIAEEKANLEIRIDELQNNLEIRQAELKQLQAVNSLAGLESGNSAEADAVINKLLTELDLSEVWLSHDESDSAGDPEVTKSEVTLLRRRSTIKGDPDVMERVRSVLKKALMESARLRLDQTTSRDGSTSSLDVYSGNGKSGPSLWEFEDLKLKLDDERCLVAQIKSELETEKQRTNTLTAELNVLKDNSDSDMGSSMNDELNDALRSECDSLRDRVVQIEKAMREAHRDQEKLADEVAYKHRECEKLKALNSAISLRANSSGSNEEEVEALRSRCETYETELVELRQLREAQMTALSSRTRTVSAFAIIPLMLLLTAVMISLYMRLAN